MTAQPTYEQLQALLDQSLKQNIELAAIVQEQLKANRDTLDKVKTLCKLLGFEDDVAPTSLETMRTILGKPGA
jgi:hypothetical protein